MHPKLLANLVDRLDATYRFKRYLALYSPLKFLRFVSLITCSFFCRFTILIYCLEIGVHYSFTGVLDRLEIMGYAKRQSNPDDRRSIMISLTAAGKEVAFDIRNLVGKANRELLQKLSEEEEAMLRGLLRRLK